VVYVAVEVESLITVRVWRTVALEVMMVGTTVSLTRVRVTGNVVREVLVTVVREHVRDGRLRSPSCAVATAL